MCNSVICLKFQSPHVLKRALMSLLLLSCKKGWGWGEDPNGIPTPFSEICIYSTLIYLFHQYVILFIFVSIQLIGLHVIQRRVNPQYLNYNIYRDITNGYSTHNLHLKKNGEYMMTQFLILTACFKNVSNLHNQLVLLHY